MRQFLLAALLCVSATASAEVPRPGHVVFAEWRPNAWYHGRIDGRCPGGLSIRFDDGDRACQPSSRIAVDRVPYAIGLNARVVARWGNGRMYPGFVRSRTAGGLYTIQFDDGARRSVPISMVRTVGR
jgi:hypothetical protein